MINVRIEYLRLNLESLYIQFRLKQCSYERVQQVSQQLDELINCHMRQGNQKTVGLQDSEPS